MEEIKQFILDYIQSEYTIPSDTDVDQFNFVETGFIDSIGIVSFVVELEDTYGITFSDEELTDPRFQIVGSLTEMIRGKMGEIK